MALFGWFAEAKAEGPEVVVTNHDLDACCQRHGATHERVVLGTGEVQMRLLKPSGDTLAVVGQTTRDAMAKLVTKADTCWRDA